MAEAVTFVVAKHNYGRYLGEAVGSLLDQTYQPLDVVIVDDASTDPITPDVLARFETQARVRIVRDAERRVNRVADNEGVDMARGDLVGTLDGDDFCLDRDAVRRQVALFETDPSIGFVYTAYALCDAD